MSKPDGRNWYYDYRIEINVKELPDALQEIIEGLELADKESDDIKYDYYLEILDVEGRQQIRNGTISEGMYHNLMRKYAWYV